MKLCLQARRQLMARKEMKMTAWLMKLDRPKAMVRSAEPMKLGMTAWSMEPMKLETVPRLMGTAPSEMMRPMTPILH